MFGEYESRQSKSIEFAIETDTRFDSLFRRAGAGLLLI